jgi:hypothetical protein
MKHLYRITLLTITLISIFSCQKKGCTDCNAINYNNNAKKNDNSCLYSNENKLGTYSVSDSILIAPAIEWIHRNYEIEIKRSSCAPNNLTISNYANKYDSFNGFLSNVDCQISNNSILITEQVIDRSDPWYNLLVEESPGYFSNDSIQFTIDFTSEGGITYYGKCFGTKN